MFNFADISVAIALPQMSAWRAAIATNHRRFIATGVGGAGRMNTTDNLPQFLAYSRSHLLIGDKNLAISDWKYAILLA